jgi:hypothetical protein
MFCVARKLKITLGLMLLFTFLIATPVIARSIIGTIFPISSSSEDDETPAIVYNNNRREYLVVWHIDRANNDDIWAQRLDKTGAKIGGPFNVSHETGHEKRFPDVAYNSEHDQYLVVWENLETSTSYRSIRARRLSGTGVLADPTDIIITSADMFSSFDPTHPAVAYSFTSDRFTVVWAEYWNSSKWYYICAQKITPYGIKEDPEEIISSYLSYRGKPDIAYNRHADRHLVVWEEKQPSISSIVVVNGIQLKGDGGMFGSTFSYGSHPTSSTNPAVAAIPTSPGDIKFMVVYQLWNNGGDHQIIGDFINEDGRKAGTVYPTLGPNNETLPAVAGSEDSQTFLVAWHEDVGILDTRLKGHQYTSEGTDLAVTHEFPLSLIIDPNAAVAAGYMGDFLVGWQGIQTTDYNILGVLFGNRNYIPLINH